MDSLKSVLARYVDNNRKIAELNAQIAELRDDRRTIELDLAALAAENQVPERIELRNSQLLFTVKKPGEWKKGWTLSKKQLAEYMKVIAPTQSDELTNQILRLHEPKLVGTDYVFELKPSSPQ